MGLHGGHEFADALLTLLPADEGVRAGLSGGLRQVHDERLSV
jgi:hypothetical protein